MRRQGDAPVESSSPLSSVSAPATTSTPASATSTPQPQSPELRPCRKQLFGEQPVGEQPAGEPRALGGEQRSSTGSQSNTVNVIDPAVNGQFQSKPQTAQLDVTSLRPNEEFKEREPAPNSVVLLKFCRSLCVIRF